MKILFLLFFALTFHSHGLHAEFRSVSDKIYSPDYMVNKQKISIPNSNLSQEIDLIGHHSGSRLLTDKKRSIVQIKSLEELNDLPDPVINRILAVIKDNKSSHINQLILNKYYIFANFVHSALYNPDENEFYIAIIPRSAVFKKVSLQVEWFGEGAGAHSQVRFEFDQPITIIPQESDSYPILTIDKGDIVYSLQAIRAEGGEVDWNPFKGLMGEFSNALQMFSTQSLAKLQIKNAYVENYSIKDLSPNQIKVIFENALKISNSEQEDGIYNTVYNSCVTHALEVLKTSIAKLNSRHFNPYSLINELGLATGGRYEKTESLNQEFQHLVDGDVMTMEKIENTGLAKKIAPFLPLIQSQEFDNVVEKMALFIIENEITYPQIKNIMIGLKTGEPLNKIIKTNEGRKLIEQIEQLWSHNFPNQPIDHFFTALEGLKIQ